MSPLWKHQHGRRVICVLRAHKLYMRYSNVHKQPHRHFVRRKTTCSPSYLNRSSATGSVSINSFRFNIHWICFPPHESSFAFSRSYAYFTTTASETQVERTVLKIYQASLLGNKKRLQYFNTWELTYTQY